MLKKRVQFFLSEPVIPGEEAVDGIKFDFCDGVRILFPNGLGEHRVMLTDRDTGECVQDTIVYDGGKFRSETRYFVNWRIEIGRKTNGEWWNVFTHDFDARRREVLFVLNTDAIGDTMAWFPYVLMFAGKHGCRTGVVVGNQLRPLLEPNYPHIKFFPRGTEKILAPYASFRLGINYECNEKFQKMNYWKMPLAQLIGYDLGLENEIGFDNPAPPIIADAGKSRICGKYVCLAINGSMKAKCWNNGEAIDETVAYLKSRGFRVLLIDREKTDLHGADDFTGDIPLVERASLIKGASFFIGMSSGLSWLAWACRVPVILLSGFTEPWHEFHTPYRVLNWHACHGCWNTPGKSFPCREDGMCECSTAINSKLVVGQIKRLIGE